jgi:transcriptional regulator with XRE-family HTH domain
MKNMTEFQNLLIQARKDMRLTLKGLSDKTGLTSGILSQYEHGNKYPTDSALKKLCACLTIDYEYARILKLSAKNPGIHLRSEKPLYPGVRASLLELCRSKKKDAHRELITELQHDKFHLIEKALIQKIITHLERANILRLPTSDKYLEYFESQRPNERMGLFHKAIQSWKYDAEGNKVEVIFPPVARIVASMNGKELSEHELSEVFEMGFKSSLTAPIHALLLKYYKTDSAGAKAHEVDDISLNYRTINISHIEDKLIAETYNHLVSTGAAKPDDDILDDLLSGPEDKIQSRVTQAIDSWSYDLTKDILSIDFKAKAGKILTKRFALWHELK